MHLKNYVAILAISLIPSGAVLAVDGACLGCNDPPRNGQGGGRIVQVPVVQQVKVPVHVSLVASLVACFDEGSDVVRGLAEKSVCIEDDSDSNFLQKTCIQSPFIIANATLRPYRENREIVGYYLCFTLGKRAKTSPDSLRAGVKQD